MSIRIIALGRTLPTEFLQYINEEWDEPPPDTHVGDIVVDHRRKSTWMVAHFGNRIPALSVVQFNVSIVHDAYLPSSVSTHSRRFIMSAEDVKEDQYQGGLLLVDGGTGQGHRYVIASNTATDSNDDIKVELVEKLETALDRHSLCQLVSDPARNVLRGSVSRHLPAGVAARAFAAGKYGWIQIAGIATVVTAPGVSQSQNDGTPFVKAAGGRVNRQSVSSLAPIVGTPLTNRSYAGDENVAIMLTLARNFI